jgi:peptide deformylase
MIKITEYPAVVETPCIPVRHYNTGGGAIAEGFGDLAGTCWEMIEFVRARSGFGLAAPQIGDFRTYFVVNYGPKPLIVINPSVTLLIDGVGCTKNQEGCYSSLGKMFEVKRAKKIHATWFDLLGRKQDAFLDGMLAVVFQHEWDHLNQKCIAQVGKEVVRK